MGGVGGQGPRRGGRPNSIFFSPSLEKNASLSFLFSFLQPTHERVRMRARKEEREEAVGDGGGRGGGGKGAVSTDSLAYYIKKIPSHLLSSHYSRAFFL